MLFLLPYERIFNWDDLFLKAKAKIYIAKKEMRNQETKKCNYLLVI